MTTWVVRVVFSDAATYLLTFYLFIWLFISCRDFSSYRGSAHCTLSEKWGINMCIFNYTFYKVITDRLNFLLVE